MKAGKIKVLTAGAALVISTWACRPVLTVGWTEVLILGAVILFAISPLLVRLFRFYIRLKEGQEDRDGWLIRPEAPYSTINSVCLRSTFSWTSTLMRDTVPCRGDVSSFCIFMDSRINNTSPSSTS